MSINWLNQLFERRKEENRHRHIEQKRRLEDVEETQKKVHEAFNGLKRKGNNNAT